MQNSFDPVAADYDDHFSNTLIGKAQRDIVWKYLIHRKIINKNILELTCGTGEDAIFMAANNFVTATDASNEMVKITHNKIYANELQSKCITLQWDLNYPYPGKRDEKFDLIFSNFGGLNCISPVALKTLSSALNNLLNPGGKLIFVVMGRFCLWEWIYFIWKGKFKEVTRRRAEKGIIVKLNAAAVAETWYYSPEEMQNYFSDHFNFIKKKPVGLFIPPSYLNPFFENRKRLVKALITSEKIFGRWKFLSGWADHYLVELNKSF